MEPHLQRFSMDRERDAGGKYVEEVNQEDVLQVFKQADLPVLTAKEVADELACARPTAYNKLEALTKDEHLLKKQVGSRAVVYIYLDRLLDPTDN